MRNKAYRNGIELINTDHKYWFTPFTIGKVLLQAGIKPIELFFANYSGIGGNGANYFSQKVFGYLSRFFKKSFSYKSYRGDQIIILGEM